MKRKRFRLTVLALMILVALCAFGLGGYRAYERRRECLARAKQHENSPQGYRKEEEFYLRMARMDEVSEQRANKNVPIYDSSRNAYWNESAKKYHSMAASDRAKALTYDYYANSHERLKNRYLDLARHPWKALPHGSPSDSSELLAALESIASQEPSAGASHENFGGFWVQNGDYGRAIREFELAIKLDDGAFMARNDCAWILATCPVAEFRDGKKAIALATHVCEMAEWKDSTYLDTLAAAYAEAGQFHEAVHWQSEALKLLEKSSEDRAGYTERLRLYEAKKPFRQQAPSQGDRDSVVSWPVSERDALPRVRRAAAQ